MDARHRGEDIIDFGMGNPDQPAPKHIVEKLVEASKREDTHGYSISKGIPACAEQFAIGTKHDTTLIWIQNPRLSLRSVQKRD